MKYERLTKRGVNILDRRGDGKTIYIRLAILEDMIEDGKLIERYFIQEDELPNGKIWYNVCELNERYASIERQCNTREEAERALRELWRKE